jgi:hypothetical protein
VARARTLPPRLRVAVGRTKAIAGVEIDQMQPRRSNDGGFPGNNAGTACGFAGGCKGAGSAGGGLDLNTDVAGLFEVKWIYTEFDLTGKDSRMPFIPILTVARLGGQPFGTSANYKLYYANGDFAGLDMYSTFTPDIKNHLAFVLVEDQRAGGNRLPASTSTQNRTSRGEDYAVHHQSRVHAVQGLDLKPMFSWFHADGVTATVRGATRSTRVRSGRHDERCARTRVSPAGGGSPAAAATMHEERHGRFRRPLARRGLRSRSDGLISVG